MAYITISRDNFYHNIDQICTKVGSIDKVAIVLKDNAYGHGIELIAQLASEYGIKHAVVKNIEEAYLIEKLFSTILILNDQPIEHERFYFAINNLETLQSLNTQAQIELKIDTGMHRNGIAIEEVEEAIDTIKQKNLNLKGVMSHYRSADEFSSELFWQQKNFKNIINFIRNSYLTDFRVHSQNSAATLRLNHFDEDLVRVGISAYGYNELPHIFDTINLKPIIKLFASRVSSRVLKRHNRVGYGGEGYLHHTSQASTYDIGYGNGWLRATKNMPLNDSLKIIGRVSMDFISINSNLQEICIMDNAQQVADYCDTISYEITTRLDHKIKRKII
jgi:alanine racemase